MPSEAAIPGLQRVVVSAPFGNYVQPAGTTPTMGTFTLARRRGRVGAILRTVRPYPKLGAWVNRIGLRNPGISWLEGKAARGYGLADKLVSVHGFNEEEWAELVDRGAALKPLGLELNMSCPNVAHQAPPAGLFAHAAACGVPVVVKLPPLRFRPMLDAAVAAGLRAFHCCNTLPVKGGGMSGRPLKPLALEVIEKLRALPGGEALTIIGGGGIQEADDLDEYAAVGADHFALGTVLMSPVVLFSHARVKPFLERARELAERPRQATDESDGSDGAAEAGHAPGRSLSSDASDPSVACSDQNRDASHA